MLSYSAESRPAPDRLWVVALLTLPAATLAISTFGLNYLFDMLSTINFPPSMEEAFGYAAGILVIVIWAALFATPFTAILALVRYNIPIRRRRPWYVIIAIAVNLLGLASLARITFIIANGH